MQDYRFGNFLCALREEAGLTQTARGLFPPVGSHTRTMLRFRWSRFTAKKGCRQDTGTLFMLNRTRSLMIQLRLPRRHGLVLRL